MNTDGFFTVCTTCSARLKVREASAIGQILACPKCGSMVMVEAPEGLETEAAEQADHIEPIHEASANSQPSEWGAPSSVATTSWLGVAAGSVVGVALLGGITVWLQRPLTTDTPRQVTATMEASDAASEEDPINSAADRLPTDNVSTKETVEADTSDAASELHPVREEPELFAVPDEGDIFAQVDENELLEDPDRTITDDSVVSASFSSPLSPEPTAHSNPATLSNLAKLLSGSAEDTLDKSQVQSQTEIAGTTLAMKSIQPSRGLESTRNDIESKLDTRIRAMRFDELPMVDFLRSMMQVSGVPIQLDPEALEQTANTSAATVSFAAIEMSTLDILRKTLEPIHLVPVVEENVVRISSPRLEDATLTQVSFFVGDLRSGKGRDLDLATLVATLIEPDTWSAVGGPGSIEMKGERLSVSNSRMVTIRTLLLLEKLRAVRGMKSRKRIPKHLTTLEPRWTQIGRYLRRRINLDVWQDAPLPQVIEQLEKASGLQLLVDWSSLRKINLTPETTTTLYARMAPASDVFGQFSSANNLALIPVDGKTLQITTNEVKTSRRYLEFYSLEQLGGSGMRMVEQLMLDGSAALDPASEVALVVGDTDVHRSLAE